MKRFFLLFQQSARSLKNIRVLTTASLLVALYAVTYSPVAGNVVIVPQLMELRFGFLVIALAGMLHGPAVALLVGLLGDFVGTILFYGGSFFFGYTISWMLMGLVFGCMLWQQRLCLPRIIATMGIVTVVINQFLTTLWQSLMFGTPYWPRFVARIPQNAIMFLVNTFLLFVVLRGLERTLEKGWHSA